MKVVVEEAIKEWEKRVVFKDLELVERKDNYVRFRIFYEIIGIPGTKQVDIAFPSS
jgi:hypothetical protein